MAGMQQMRFAAERFPAELIPRLAELGLFGATLQGYGCAGLSYTAYGLVCAELERGDSSLRSCVSVQSSLVMGCIHACGSEQQRSRWLPGLARGTKLGCFALTEAHGGSDPARMRTRAQRRGGDWVLEGAKHWITNGALADVAIVWAATDDGIAAFLVERGTPGFEARVIKNKLCRYVRRARPRSRCRAFGCRSRRVCRTRPGSRRRFAASMKRASA
jgi:glutaryl-CoA dehydrogenase